MLKWMTDGSKNMLRLSRIATSVAWNKPEGQDYTVLQKRLLATVKLDVVKLGPVIFIAVVPFMEFALPPLLWAFPGILPSTLDPKHMLTGSYQKYMTKMRGYMAQIRSFSDSLLSGSAAGKTLMRALVGSNLGTANSSPADEHDDSIESMLKNSYGLSAVDISDCLRSLCGRSGSSGPLALSKIDSVTLKAMLGLTGVPVSPLFSRSRSYLEKKAIKDAIRLLREDVDIIKQRVRSLNSLELDELLNDRNIFLFEHVPTFVKRRLLREYLTSTEWIRSVVLGNLTKSGTSLGGLEDVYGAYLWYRCMLSTKPLQENSDNKVPDSELASMTPEGADQPGKVAGGSPPSTSNGSAAKTRDQFPSISPFSEKLGSTKFMYTMRRLLNNTPSEISFSQKLQMMYMKPTVTPSASHLTTEENRFISERDALGQTSALGQAGSLDVSPSVKQISSLSKSLLRTLNEFENLNLTLIEAIAEVEAQAVNGAKAQGESKPQGEVKTQGEAQSSADGTQQSGTSPVSSSSEEFEALVESLQKLPMQYQKDIQDIVNRQHSTGSKSASSQKSA